MAKNNFAAFEEKCVFGEKVHFCGFGGKYVLMGLAEKYLFAVWTGKVYFAVLAGKVFLMEKVFFSRFWREKFFRDFGGKSLFS